ncbi:hypothetical protein [Bosea sp. FBZP-16]|uniref:hypothetical protein n=1 Tax=Bosea sp. FBZP-16 TaxID=2065382 RepID=UPI000C304A47|nr:hypothetical protein [Bosea sp. FBZP-16]
MTTMIERVAAANKRAWDGWPEPITTENLAQVREAAARAAIAAMREGLPDFGEYPLVERLARECESAGTDDETWAKFKALAEWVSSFDAALEEKL